jgi:flagellar biosynthesis protein FlhF
MKLTLSYITTGQNVPDDIVVATPTLVSSMVVGD